MLRNTNFKAQHLSKLLLLEEDEGMETLAIMYAALIASNAHMALLVQIMLINCSIIPDLEDWTETNLNAHIVDVVSLIKDDDALLVKLS